MEKHSLKDYKAMLEAHGMLVSDNLCGQEDTEVTDVTYNSKEAVPGTLFICKGATFKKAYLEMALEAGAVGYVSDIDYEVDAPKLIVKNIREAMPKLVDFYFNQIWKKLNLIGLTGTKGKSTTVYFIKAILDDYLTASGQPDSAVLSSIRTYDGVIDEVSHLTTPEAVELHKHFARAVGCGMKFMEMEVSSQALKYNRVDDIIFDVGVFLNISEDHVSPKEHPSFEDYFHSKLRMFKQTKTACINLESDHLDEIMAAAKDCERIITFGLHPEADIYGYNIHKEEADTVFNIRCDRFDMEFRLSIPGFFNVENALAAVAALYIYDIPVEHVFTGLHRAHPSGRMEMYTTEDRKIIAIADFAHNKLSFEKLFGAMKEEYPGYKIVSFFGCPGGKALLRREAMSKVAAAYSDKVYIVADDPGPEAFEDIAAELESYIKPTGVDYEVIESRIEAIEKAFNAVTEPTILIMAGKGNDEFITYGNKYIPCESDGQCAVRLIRAYDETHRDDKNTQNIKVNRKEI